VGPAHGARGAGDAQAVAVPIVGVVGDQGAIDGDISESAGFVQRFRAKFGLASSKRPMPRSIPITSSDCNHHPCATPIQFARIARPPGKPRVHDPPDLLSPEHHGMHLGIQGIPSSQNPPLAYDFACGKVHTHETAGRRHRYFDREPSSSDQDMNSTVLYARDQDSDRILSSIAEPHLHTSFRKIERVPSHRDRRPTILRRGTLR